MHSYVIESKKDLKEIFCGLPLRNLVEIQQCFTNIIEIKNNKANVLDKDYFLAKEIGDDKNV